MSGEASARSLVAVPYRVVGVSAATYASAAGVSVVVAGGGGGGGGGVLTPVSTISRGAPVPASRLARLSAVELPVVTAKPTGPLPATAAVTSTDGVPPSAKGSDEPSGSPGATGGAGEESISRSSHVVSATRRTSKPLFDALAAVNTRVARVTVPCNPERSKRT